MTSSWAVPQAVTSAGSGASSAVVPCGSWAARVPSAETQRRQERPWFVEAEPWTALPPVIRQGLDRPSLNGVRLFVGQGGDFTDCEVRINGRRHEPSTAALTELDWPRTEQMSVARTFLLLVHPADGHTSR